MAPCCPGDAATPRNLARALRYPLIAAAVVLVALFALGVRQAPALVAFATYAMVTTGIAHEWLRGSRARHRRGENYAVAFGRLLWGNRPRYGGYVVHLAIIMLAVGATASSYYSAQRDVAMSPGDTETLGGYSFEYVGVTARDFPDRQEETAEFDVYLDGDYLGKMYPLPRGLSGVFASPPRAARYAARRLRTSTWCRPSSTTTARPSSACC